MVRIVDTGTDILIKGILRSITCDSISTATIQIFENNVCIAETITDSTGGFRVIIPSNNMPGTRNFKVVYTGDANYNGTESVDIIVEVREVPVLTSIQLTSNKSQLQLGERFILTARCIDQYGEPLKNILVTFKDNNNVLGTKSSDNEGLINFKITPDTNKIYKIHASGNSEEVISNTVNVIVDSHNIYEVLADLNDKIENIDLDNLELPDYVAKSELTDNTKYNIDLDLHFGLRGLDDTIIIDMNIVDHIVNKTIYTRR